MQFARSFWVLPESVPRQTRARRGFPRGSTFIRKLYRAGIRVTYSKVGDLISTTILENQSTQLPSDTLEHLSSVVLEHMSQLALNEDCLSSLRMELSGLIDDAARSCDVRFSQILLNKIVSVVYQYIKSTILEETRTWHPLLIRSRETSAVAKLATAIRVDQIIWMPKKPKKRGYKMSNEAWEQRRPKLMSLYLKKLNYFLWEVSKRGYFPHFPVRVPDRPWIWHQDLVKITSSMISQLEETICHNLHLEETYLLKHKQQVKKVVSTSDTKCKHNFNCVVSYYDSGIKYQGFRCQKCGIFQTWR